jgi:hypothetical protein
MMNIQESIRRILREEFSKEVMWLLRRLEDPNIMNDLEETVKSTANFLDPCGMTEDDFFDEVMENSIYNFINHWEELYETDDFLPIDDLVYNLIHEKYEDYIIGKYQSKIAFCD